MNDSVRNHKIIDFRESSEPSQLEKEYVKLYGREFVDDLKRAFRWMKMDMRKQPPKAKIAKMRRSLRHSGGCITAFYVDFRKESLYSQTIDSYGGKTIHEYKHSPCLKTDTNHNIRYLLSGLLLYDEGKAKKWREKLLGGAKIWFEEF